MNISPCGMPASPQDWACRLLAATLRASGFEVKLTSILRDGVFGPAQDEGGWRAEKRKILMARALRHAGAFRRANHGGCGIGPCFRPVRRAADAPTDPSVTSWQGLLIVSEGCH